MSYLNPSKTERAACRYECPRCQSPRGTWCRVNYGSRAVVLHQGRLDRALAAATATEYRKQRRVWVPNS